MLFSCRSSYGGSPAAAAAAATWRQPRGSPDKTIASEQQQQQQEEEDEGDTVLRGDSSTSGGHVAAAAAAGGHRRSASLDRFKTAADKTISGGGGGGGGGGGAASPLALAAALTSGGRDDLNAFNTNQLLRTPGGSGRPVLSPGGGGGGVSSSPDKTIKGGSPGSRHPSKRALHEAVRSKKRQLFDFLIKTIVLPRQARDEHRENSKREMRLYIYKCLFSFLAGEVEAQPRVERQRLSGQRGGGGGAALRRRVVRKTPLFEPFSNANTIRFYKNDRFYQDRLGTNIRKALQNSTFVLG